MKRINLILIVILVCSISNAQNKPYYDAMSQTIEQLGKNSENDNYQKCSDKFERIAVAEKDEWLPYYYASYSCILMSFNEYDGEKKDKILDRAQLMLDAAFNITKDESELYALQAFLYPSRIIVDPMARGLVYIEKCFASLETAKALNPENPRAYFLLAINKLNMPPSMGGGPEVAIPLFQEAEKKFKAFHSDDPLWPSWGEEANRNELAKLNL
ncbi:hypothetical protein ACFLT1_01095 [Bacteroidota bacterium]